MPVPAWDDAAVRQEDSAAPVQAWETTGPFTPAPPEPPWADPRPDLSADHAHWLGLLALAYRRDAEDTEGVFGALHGLRCCGARMASGGEVKPSWRLMRGEMTAAEWQFIREKWLLPHLVALRELLNTPITVTTAAVSTEAMQNR